MKINVQKLNSHRSYTIKELSGLLGINERTLFRWIDDGLEIVEGCKQPILITGQSVKDFNGKRRQKNKCKLGRNEFYCFHCKAATNAKKGSTNIKDGKKTALCRVCSSKISRIIKPRRKDYTIPAAST